MELAEAVESLRAGLVVGLPTDTVYGIAADPMQRDAVQRLFAAKRRPEIKPIPILASSVVDVGRIAVLAPEVAEEVQHHWPGALTLILPKAEGVPEWIGTADTVGVRVPDLPVAIALLAAVGPLAVTSANLSGQSPMSDDVEARSVFADAVATYLPGAAGGGMPSTVVDVTGERPVVIRAGPIVWSGP